MICGDCGETNKPGTEFCMFCGAYLGWQEQEPAGANDVTQVLPAQPPAPTPASAETPPAPARQATPFGGAGRWLSPNDPQPRPESAARSRTGPTRSAALPGRRRGRPGAATDARRLPHLWPRDRPGATLLRTLR